MWSIDLSEFRSGVKSKCSEWSIGSRVAAFEKFGCNIRDRGAIAIIVKVRKRVSALMGRGYSSEAYEIGKRLEEVEKELEEIEEAIKDVPLSE